MTSFLRLLRQQLRGSIWGQPAFPDEVVAAGVLAELNPDDYKDYGTAQNLFTNGQAAMFYMGSWETSMALNEDIPEEIRDNIRVFTMPTIGASCK